jgi:hypothetical protein
VAAADRKIRRQTHRDRAGPSRWIGRLEKNPSQRSSRSAGQGMTNSQISE